MTLSHVTRGVREPSSMTRFWGRRRVDGVEALRHRADAVLGATSRRWRGSRRFWGDVASMARVSTGRLLHLGDILRDDPADAALGAPS